MAKAPVAAPAANPPPADENQVNDLGGEGEVNTAASQQEELDAAANPPPAGPEDDLVAVISIGQSGTAPGTIVHVRAVHLDEAISKGHVMLQDPVESDDA
jgi:hypothetical protein